MYTEREMPFPSHVTFIHTKVAPPLILLSILSPYCIQNDVTSQCLSPEHLIQKIQTHTTIAVPNSSFVVCFAWFRTLIALTTY